MKAGFASLGRGIWAHTRVSPPVMVAIDSRGICIAVASFTPVTEPALRDVLARNLDLLDPLKAEAA